MQQTKESIIQTLKTHGKQLETYGFEIGLFESFVRNEATANSDIDLLVNIKKEKKTFRNFMSLIYYLEDLLNCKVELVTKQSLSPFIGPHKRVKSMFPSQLDFVQHILHECLYLSKECSENSFEDFLKNERISKAVCRSLEIIGEASQKIHPNIKAKYSYLP